MGMGEGRGGREGVATPHHSAFNAHEVPFTIDFSNDALKFSILALGVSLIILHQQQLSENSYQNMGTETLPSPANPLSWKKSFVWLAIAIACFHAAYTSVQYPAAGLLIFGYALGLVKLTNQPTVRRAFYFGLATGFLCYGPQLWFFFKIFNVAAVVLWLVLAFWVGLFTAISCGAIRRWGMPKAAWLIPIIWTGLEYFRSELYYLKFSCLDYFLGSINKSVYPFHGLRQIWHHQKTYRQAPKSA